MIYYLRRDQINDAYDLIRDLEPSTPQEYIIKGVVNATLGQLTNSRYSIYQYMDMYVYA